MKNQKEIQQVLNLYEEECLATIKISKNNNIRFNELQFKTYDLYNGISGLGLVLLDLFKVTGEKKYLNVCEKIARKIITDKNYPQNTSFYCGTTGISFYFLSLFRITNNTDYKTEALALLTKISPSKYEKCELLNGLAGTILGLLKCYSLHEDELLLNHLETATKHLISEAKYHNRGCYWDEAYLNIMPLCGMAHGVSGISMTLFQVASFFNNAQLAQLAIEGLKYEDQFYNEIEANWPDFRTKHNTSSDLKMFKKGNSKHFEKTYKMNAWCHGALGMTLVRLDYLNKGNPMGDLKAKLIKNYKSIKEAFLTKEKSASNLCHGFLGEAMFFLEFNNNLKLPETNKLISHSIKLVKQRLSNNNFTQPGLFLGLTGVGHYLLQLISNDHQQSYFYPKVYGKVNTKISTQQYPNLSINKFDLGYIICKKLYPMSISSFPKSEFSRYLTNFSKSNDHSIVSYCKNFLKKINANETLETKMRIDQMAFSTQNKLKNHYLANTREIFIENILKQNNLPIHELEILFNKRSDLFKTNRQFFILFKGIINQEILWEITQAEYMFLDFFQSKSTFKIFEDELKKNFQGNETVLNKSIFHFKKKLKFYLKKHILIPSEIDQYDLNIKFKKLI